MKNQAMNEDNAQKTETPVPAAEVDAWGLTPAQRREVTRRFVFAMLDLKATLAAGEAEKGDQPSV